MNWYEHGARSAMAEADEIRAVLARLIDEKVPHDEAPHYSTKAFCIAEQLWWEGQE